jgi:hypothetical protein
MNFLLENPDAQLYARVHLTQIAWAIEQMALESLDGSPWCQIVGAE